jgi:hypothetical protein
MGQFAATGNGNNAWFRRMFMVQVAACGADVLPAIVVELLEQVAVLHCGYREDNEIGGCIQPVSYSSFILHAAFQLPHFSTHIANPPLRPTITPGYSTIVNSRETYAQTAGC